MLQVDVLKPDGAEVSYSKLFAPGSLFSITPCTREFCQRWSAEAERYQAKPIPYIEPQRQLGDGDPTRANDFFEWCQVNGFEDVDDPDCVRDPDRLQEALEAYTKRHEREVDDEDDQASAPR